MLSAPPIRDAYALMAKANKEKSVDAAEISRQPAEILFHQELEALKKQDTEARPPGWVLSPRAVLKFICGSKELNIRRKFYGDDLLVERCIVTLMSNRALILVGEPGTAKSMLSELLATAICGSSSLTIQGTAGVTEDQIRYSWNYARLISEGPGLGALVPAPVYTGMREGKLVRFEEMTRTVPEIQDTLISLLSERMMFIAELPEEDGIVYAKKGFNVIATANIRDRGVHEMSSALKRRFNFETVFPIRERNQEIALVKEQAASLLEQADTNVKLDQDVVELLVTIFHDMREGKTSDGGLVERPEAVLSTAEAVSACFAAALHARHFDDGILKADHIARQLPGTVFKDNADDAKKLTRYLDTVAKVRAKGNKVWKQFYEARKFLERME